MHTAGANIDSLLSFCCCVWAGLQCHGNVRPETVLLMRSGDFHSVVLTDFSLATSRTSVIATAAATAAASATASRPAKAAQRPLQRCVIGSPEFSAFIHLLIIISRDLFAALPCS